MSIKNVVERSDTRAGRAFDLAVQALIFLSLASFCVETLPDLSPSLRTFLWIFEIVSVGLFTLEYLLRFAVADRKLSFVFSFYGLVDLLAILPFYVAGGLDLRAVRVLRVFRLVRVLKLVRYNRAIDRFSKAMIEIREELTLYLGATIVLVFVASVGIYYCEHEAQPEQFGSVFDAMWWSVVTLTTVGYGDMYPVTAGGKIFTCFVVVLGLGFVAVPPALLASALTRARQQEPERAEEAQDRDAS